MKGERGYTLVEALIAIAITGFLVTVIGMAVQNTETARKRQQESAASLPGGKPGSPRPKPGKSSAAQAIRDTTASGTQ